MTSYNGRMWTDIVAETRIRGALQELQAAVSACNYAKGWREQERSFGDDVALLHSEVSEALEAFRSYGETSIDGPDGKPEGVGAELADVLIRLLDTVDLRGIDLHAELVRKYRYNWTRSYRHGDKNL